MNRSMISALAILFVCRAPLARAQLNVVELTAKDITDGYAAGGFTAVKITEAFLDRIEKYEPNYNAFVSFHPDALATAAALDQELKARGSRGPLHGVPIVIKEAMDVAGLPSTAGFAAYSCRAGGIDLIPETDAPLVARLRAAGAIILGKTNIPAFSLDGTRANSSWAGPTFNAYDRMLAPGASSSGTATAVAASFAVLGMAEETGGSIQNPAGAQSLVGIKPTFGLVPNAGVVPLAGSTRDVVGPHAKTVYDAAITLDAIVGYTPEDPKTIVAIGNVPESGYRRQLSTTALQGKRIGLFGPGWRRATLTRETQTLYDQAKAVLGAEGAVLIDDPFIGSGFANLSPQGSFDARGFESIVYDFQQYLKRLGPSAAADSLDELRAITGVDLFGTQGPLSWVHDLPIAKNSISNPDLPPDLSGFQRDRDRFLEIFTNVMETQDLDALAFPQMRIPAPRLFSTAEIDALTVSEINMLGTPGVTVPAGYYANGAPFSLIFLGEAFSEAELLGYAYDFEQATRQRVAPTLSLPGDLNMDGVLDGLDIDLLTDKVLSASRDLLFDFNYDRRVNGLDRRVWVVEFAKTYFGDANLDGEFNSSDLVSVFQSGQYEDGIAANSTWSGGDWNGDREFDSADFVISFQEGGYEKGPRNALRLIPEPAGAVMLVAAWAIGVLRFGPIRKRR
jgi:Asp-tRNA(Asn)/Glu-tRNA(Gln) amidotransferase A subunit family amidase